MKKIIIFVFVCTMSLFAGDEQELLPQQNQIQPITFLITDPDWVARLDDLDNRIIFWGRQVQACVGRVEVLENRFETQAQMEDVRADQEKSDSDKCQSCYSCCCDTAQGIAQCSECLGSNVCGLMRLAGTGLTSVLSLVSRCCSRMCKK